MKVALPVGPVRIGAVLMSTSTVLGFLAICVALEVLVGITGLPELPWMASFVLASGLAAAVLRRRSVPLGTIVLGAWAATLLALVAAWSWIRFGLAIPVGPSVSGVAWHLGLVGVSVVIVFLVVRPAQVETRWNRMATW